MIRVIDLQNKTVSLLCCTVHPYSPKLNLCLHGLCLFGLNQGSSDHSIGLIFGGYNVLSGVNKNNPNGARNALVLVGQHVPHYNQRKRKSTNSGLSSLLSPPTSALKKKNKNTDEAQDDDEKDNEKSPVEDDDDDDFINDDDDNDDNDDRAGTCYYETDSDDDEEFETDPTAVT